MRKLIIFMNFILLNFVCFNLNIPLVKGEKVVSKGSVTADSIKRMIDGLKEGENIAYIYDNYDRVPKEIIDLVKPDDSRFVLVKDTDVQGSEYNYTIIIILYI